MLELYGITGPADRSALRRRADRAGRHRLDRRGAGRTAIRSSRIRRSSTRASTTRGSRGRQSFKTGYEYQAINTQIDDFNPKYGRDTYGGQFSRPATRGRRSGHLQPRRLHVRRCATATRSSTRSSPTCASGCTSPICRTTSRSSRRLTLNLGLRYEFATPQWEKDNFLTNFDPGDQHADPGEGRLDLRPRAGQSRSQQLRAAPRRSPSSIDDKTVLRSGYGISYIHFNRLGGENLLSFNGPHVVGLSITQQPSQGAVRRATTAPTTCFRTTQQGYPEGLNDAGELQHAERARELHPEGQPDRQRAELARRRCSARSCRTCWSTSATSATRAATS